MSARLAASFHFEVHSPIMTLPTPRRLRGVLVAILCAAALCGCMESFFFYKTDQIAYFDPIVGGLRHETVRFKSSDGTLLSGWFVPSRAERRGTVVFFHGNNKNISGHFRYVDWLPASGYDVFTFDYRGYGASEGNPSPRGIHDDCLAALAYVRSRPDVDRERIFVFAQSLGGNYALSALANADRRGIRAAVIEGAFASHREIAQDRAPAYPLPEALGLWLADNLFDDRYDSVEAVARIDDVPLLFIHGDQDKVVEYRHAGLLNAAAKGRHELWTIPGGQHLDTFIRRQEPYRRKLLEYLARS